MNKLLRTALASAAAAATTWPAGVLAQAETAGTEQVVITGSVAERVAAQAPFAISVIGRDTLRNSGAQINLSEALARVPGLVVANRSNYAQDLQISSRGFGARAGFGVRGVRLLSDGIPATGPDGQGQVAQFDLAGAQRVEVLRGPFSVLYGNSSGGVISLISAPVKQSSVEGELDGGSFGLRQARVGGSLLMGAGLDLKLSASAMQTDGFRPQSEAKRQLASARLGWQAGADTLTVLAGYYSQPAKDPLGLTRAQFNADPLQTTSQATQFDTRKESTQQQLGANWKHRFEAAGPLRELQLMAYAGQRSVTQYLAIAPATQTASARHGGGVVDFDRDFAGTEARLRLAWEPFELQVGTAFDDQKDARRGYENFTGTGSTQVLGVIGKLRRDETNRARSADVFAQGEWTPSASFSASAGLRSGRVKLSADDRYLSNGDDSGAVSFDYTNPVLGLRWQALPGLQLHASAARGFESPTLGELAYRADNSSGLNLGLKPQRSQQFELGAKWRGGGFDADVALFEARVKDEIGVATNAGGRSAFQNVGRTLRQGAEVSAGWQALPTLRLRAAATLLEAKYRDNFLTCTGIPCNAATVPVPAGNRIAGTQRGTLFGEAAWNSGFGELGFELRGSTQTQVNDVNSDTAGAYTVAALRWNHALNLGAGLRGEWLVRVDNLLDRSYAGSVIVNEANGRYFETGAPRNVTVALRLQWLP